MDFFSLTIATLLYGTNSVSIPIFIVSVILLFTGIALQVRARAMHLTFLEHKPLNWIEHTHPHLPSPRIITTIALCCVTLLLAALQTMSRTFPFDDPYQGLNLASLFLLGGAVGVLAELKWKNASDYVCAVLVGTAVAFMLLILRFNYEADLLTRVVVPLALLVPSILLAGQNIVRGRDWKILLTMILSFSFWILLYTGR
jgi:hypothetical protein